MANWKERARWMHAFEQEVLRLAPQCAGRIAWDTATHFFNQHYSPTHAAERYVTSLEA
jgi:hypothetical protein